MVIRTLQASPTIHDMTCSWQGLKLKSAIILILLIIPHRNTHALLLVIGAIHASGHCPQHVRCYLHAAARYHGPDQRFPNDAFSTKDARRVFSMARRCASINVNKMPRKGGTSNRSGTVSLFLCSLLYTRSHVISTCSLPTMCILLPTAVPPTPRRKIKKEKRSQTNDSTRLFPVLLIGL